jgi:hypothetical protein
VSALAGRIEQSREAGRQAGLLLDRVTVNLPIRSPTAALKLGWWPTRHGMEPGSPTATPPGVKPRGWSKPADTFLAIPSPGEDEILDVAWSMGACDISRIERRPRDAADDLLMVSFGRGGELYAFRGGGAVINQVVDDRVPAMIPAATLDGWLSYEFVPVVGALNWRTDDPSLDAAGGRNLPRPTWATVEPLGIPPAANHPEPHAHQHIWTFSRGGKRIPLRAWQERYG